MYHYIGISELPQFAVVTITVICDLPASSTGDHLFKCGTIFSLPQDLTFLDNLTRTNRGTLKFNTI